LDAGSIPASSTRGDNAKILKICVVPFSLKPLSVANSNRTAALIFGGRKKKRAELNILSCHFDLSDHFKRSGKLSSNSGYFQDGKSFGNFLVDACEQKVMP